MAVDFIEVAVAAGVVDILREAQSRAGSDGNSRGWHGFSAE